MSSIFLDIDGCILYHHGRGASYQWTQAGSVLLPHVRARLDAWEKAGHKIILITARKEMMRVQTEAELRRFGVIWDQLIMDVGSGTRYLINDMKPDQCETAKAICIPRNKGLTDVDI